MSYDANKLTKLQALKSLALRMQGENSKLDAKITALGGRVDQAVSAGNSVLDAMYQQATPARFCTESNLITAGMTSVTDSTLEELMGDSLSDSLAVKDDEGSFTLDGGGNKQYEFKLNDAVIGTYTKNTQLSQILADINSNEYAGVQADYSETTQMFTFTAGTVGADSKVEFGDGLASAMFDTSGNIAFSEVYGLGLAEGESKKVNFNLPGFSCSSQVAADDSVKSVANKLHKIVKNHDYTAAYDKASGQLIITDEAGTAVDFKMSAGGEAISPAELSNLPYTSGQDAIFTAVKVNGEVQKVAGKAVDITVPTKVSELDNDSNFQTGGDVAAAVAAADHLKRKKVTSVDEIDLTADDADRYIYMVPKTGGRNGDTYDEYMVLDGVLEPVGDWKVDLSDYIQKEDGKRLMTDAEGNKLDGIAEGATKVEATAGSGTLTIDGTEVKLFEVAADDEVQEMLDEVFGAES